jgi:hypothetical protein
MNLIDIYCGVRFSHRVRGARGATRPPPGTMEGGDPQRQAFSRRPAVSGFRLGSTSGSVLSVGVVASGLPHWIEAMILRVCSSGVLRIMNPSWPAIQTSER